MFLIRVKHIEFKNVYFQYPHKEQYVLNDINCKINIGETLFIAGLNGAGKSTFIKVLTGLYKPTQGFVLYDGINHDELCGIYNNFAVLFQDFAKFSFDIYNNVDVLGEKNKEKIYDALNRAGVTDYIDELPDGLETKLGNIARSGVNISEGQWQRLALARAIYKDSGIYVFDEPTSALDPLAEEKIYELYGNLPQNATKIIISHRLGFARKADRIIVMDHGMIAEEGTFEDLLSGKGLFYDMFNLQKSLYVSEDDEEKEDV